MNLDKIDLKKSKAAKEAKKVASNGGDFGGGAAEMTSRPVSEDASVNLEKARLIEEGRAFFCSELVIKAFKSVGLLH